MEPGELALSDREFERIKQRVYRVAGISLSDAKRTLVVSRLLKLVKALNLPPSMRMWTFWSAAVPTRTRRISSTR